MSDLVAVGRVCVKVVLAPAPAPVALHCRLHAPRTRAKWQMNQHLGMRMERRAAGKKGDANPERKRRAR
jgi:hypothetical protein